jgi:hypothetical protein
VIGKATTVPILAEDTYTQLVALLTDPARRDNQEGPTPKYLLSGIAVCGRCGGRMRRTVGRYVEDKTTGSTKRQPSAYQCGSCYRVRRQQDLVDSAVVGAIVGRLAAPDAAELFAAGDSEVADHCRREIASIDAKLEITADQFASDEITADQLRRISTRLREQRKDAERRLEAAKPRTVLTELAGADALDRWEEIPLGAKREAVDLLLTVTIMPAGIGKRFDPELVVIDWKTDTTQKAWRHPPS